ncbi:hypothetical protein Tco_0156558 [Tanacetum coccineum]
MGCQRGEIEQLLDMDVEIYADTNYSYQDILLDYALETAAPRILNMVPSKGNMERELRVSCYTDAGYLTDADNLKCSEYIAAFDHRKAEERLVLSNGVCFLASDAWFFCSLVHSGEDVATVGELGTLDEEMYLVSGRAP